MPPTLRFTLKHNGSIISEFEQDANTQPSKLVKCLSEFQQLTNSKLTSLVESTGKDAGVDEEEDSASDEYDDVQNNAKKSKR